MKIQLSLSVFYPIIQQDICSFGNLTIDKKHYLQNTHTFGHEARPCIGSLPFII